MLYLRKYGDPILTKKTQEVTLFDESLKSEAKEMFDLMIECAGLGLAGPQAGLSKRIFVIDMRARYDKEQSYEFLLDEKLVPTDLCMPLYVVNPMVKETGDIESSGEEGCLSFPGIYVDKTRSENVELKYFDLDGNPHIIKADGLLARCIQHENDHLNGVCIPDNIHPLKYAKIETKLKKLKRETRDFLKRK